MRETDVSAQKELSFRETDRAAALLLGAATADSWSAATEIALCVADAAATGLPFTDREVAALLGRNLQLRLIEQGAADAAARTDGLLAGVAVVALAHLHDSPGLRARAVQTVIKIIDGRSEVPEEDILLWADVVAETLVTGVLPVVNLAILKSRQVADVLRACQAADQLVGSDAERFAAGTAAALSRAAAGAVLGARFGRRAAALNQKEGLSGWPNAGPVALIGLGVLVARPRGRSDASVPGPSVDPAPLLRWTPGHTPRLAPRLDTGTLVDSGRRWHLSHIALTAVDAEVAHA